MQISQLYLYPVKGARGIALDAAELDAFGMRHDRRWMVVDDAGNFVTPREHARLALVDVSVEAERLRIGTPDGAEAFVPLAQEDGDSRSVQVWLDRVEALDAGDAAAAVLSAHLGFGVRLVHMPERTLRQVDTDYGVPGDRVSFADGFPLLLISQAALDALNGRLAAPLPMLRFRPNVVVSGTRPHEEDEWRRITLGTVPCDVVKPCGRCVVTTLDPATAGGGKEPLRTLATYRRWNGHVWFGQNVIHRGAGTLRVGDGVRVQERGTPRPPVG